MHPFLILGLIVVEKTHFSMILVKWVKNNVVFRNFQHEKLFFKKNGHGVWNQRMILYRIP